MPSPFAAPAARATFRAVVRAAVPFAADLDPDDLRAGEATVDAALAGRPASVRRQIGLFLRVLDLAALLLRRRRFASLGAADARAVLERLERAPLLLLRRGTWGLRTLAYMAVYTRDSVRRTIGYGATPGGWSEWEGGGMGPWPGRGGAGAPEPTVLTVDDG